MPTDRFENTTPLSISAGSPSVVTSTIDVVGLGGRAVTHLAVKLDVEHTWDRDLTITLVSPAGTRVVLVTRRGGNGDDFQGTVFDSDAAASIADAIPPFTGTFQPEGTLDDLRNGPAEGPWMLELEDSAYFDGGSLKSWALVVTGEPPSSSEFRIDVRFTGGLTTGQQAAFALAAERWSELIVGDVPDIRVDGEDVDDLLVEAQGIPIDGAGSILGQAGPTHLRPGTSLPARGVMSFDTADLSAMEADGSLVSVIIHEMGHVLGLGTIWDRLGLRQGAGTVNPRFVGQNAMREFAALTGAAGPEAVPLANRGGPGTRDAHWREAVFGNELMTGFIDAGANPISRVTVGALEDTGYTVDYDHADPYVLPTALRLAILGVGMVREDHGGHGIMLVPEPTVLPESALL